MKTRRRATQATIRLAMVVLATMILLPIGAASAQTGVRDANSENGFVNGINAERVANGLNPLVLDAGMSVAALGWTNEMVDGGFLAHASDIITGAPGNWSMVGENVGRGGTVDGLMTAFMNSPGHRSNVLHAGYTHIGVAVVMSPSGVMYTTHRFAGVPGTIPPPPDNLPFVSPTPPPPPPPPPAPAPVPVPAPAPTPTPDPYAEFGSINLDAQPLVQQENAAPTWESNAPSAPTGPPAAAPSEPAPLMGPPAAIVAPTEPAPLMGPPAAIVAPVEPAATWTTAQPVRSDRGVRAASSGAVVRAPRASQSDATGPEIPALSARAWNVVDDAHRALGAGN